MRSLPQLVQAVEYPNVSAFLRVLREGESSQDGSAFTELWGGSHFDSFDDHPRKHFPLPDGQTTSAAGAFQETETTWNDFTKVFGSMPFAPENQALCAVWLIDRAHALEDVIAGRLHAAILKLVKVWTSLALPKRQEKAGEVFLAYGGTLADETQTQIATPEVKRMPALLAFLPQVLSLIPALGNLFGSGSEVQQRNVAAASVIGDALVKATNAVNVQDAVEKMQTDKDALAAGTAAVHELLPQLMDVGGGVESARKFAADHENGRYGRILEVISYCAMFFLLLANVMSAAAAYILNDPAPLADVKQADIGAALIAFGYFLGSSVSSKRKDERMGVQ